MKNKKKNSSCNLQFMAECIINLSQNSFISNNVANISNRTSIFNQNNQSIGVGAVELQNFEQSWNQSKIFVFGSSQCQSKKNKNKKSCKNIIPIFKSYMKIKNTGTKLFHDEARVGVGKTIYQLLSSVSNMQKSTFFL